MTDQYYLELEPKLLSLERDKWWLILDTRPDKEDFVEAIKTRIDMYGDFEFSNDYTKFRRIEPYSEFIKGVENPNGISARIEWDESNRDTSWDYSHLEVNIKSYDSKEFKKKLGRQK